MAKIKVIAGAPCSGKSTYLKEHIGDNDIGFDYDLLFMALTQRESHIEPTDGQHAALVRLRGMFPVIAEDSTLDTIWIINCRPSEEFLKKCGDDIEVITMEATEEECYERLEKDDSRQDKEAGRERIRKWFHPDEKRSETMIRDNREYRDMPLLIEKMAEDEQERSYVVEGYASTFDEYELFKDGETSYCERIEPDAFKECDMSDVVFLLDHTGRVYARTRNGSVDLSVDDKGLYSKIDLSRSSSAKQTLEDIECGNYDRMSFAFTVSDDDVVHDREAKKYTRIIRSIGKLFDISAVSFPANPNTEIGVSARSAFDGFIEEEKRLELAKAEEAKALNDWKTKMKEIQNGNQ